MTRVTHPNGVLRHAIYRYRTGDGIGAQSGTLHALTPRTRFRRRAGEVQTLHEGFEAFDNWGMRGLFDWKDVGIPHGAGVHGSELSFERMATADERTFAQVEAAFHSPEHLHATSRLIARDFLNARGSVVEAVGIYGSLARNDIWPGDYDFILFVSEERAGAFLNNARRRREGKRKLSLSVIVKQGHIPDDLVDALGIPTSAAEAIEWRLRGNLMPREVEQAATKGNLMAGWRVKKLDLQILPLQINAAFREAYNRTANDFDFLRRIHPDILVFNPDTGFYTQERAHTLVHWEF